MRARHRSSLRRTPQEERPARHAPRDDDRQCHARPPLLKPGHYPVSRHLERHVAEKQAICCGLRGKLRRVEAERVGRGAGWKAAELLFQGIERDAVLREESLILL